MQNLRRYRNFFTTKRIVMKKVYSNDQMKVLVEGIFDE